MRLWKLNKLNPRQKNNHASFKTPEFQNTIEGTKNSIRNKILVLIELYFLKNFRSAIEPKKESTEKTRVCKWKRPFEIDRIRRFIRIILRLSLKASLVFLSQCCVFLTIVFFEIENFAFWFLIKTCRCGGDL